MFSRSTEPMRLWGSAKTGRQKGKDKQSRDEARGRRVSGGMSAPWPRVTLGQTRVKR
jgi:hypothetical protein